MAREENPEQNRYRQSGHSTIPCNQTKGHRELSCANGRISGGTKILGGGEACALTSPSSFLLLQLKGRREQSPATGSTFDGTMMVGGGAAHPNPTVIPVATIERSLCAFICHRNDFWWDECGWGKNCAPHPNLMLAFMWVPSSILELASLLGSAVSWT